jgi:hypothetical protein
MLDACRPKGRLFYCLLTAFLVSVVATWTGICPPVAMAASPAMTTVSDTVYQADGSPASGVVLISWPAFTAADGTPVAAGSTSAALGNNGSLSVNLVPNAGATPSGTYYTAVFQLQDVVRTEYWLVGTTSPTTLSAVRATPGVGVAAPPVSKLYVDNAIATTKAYVDSSVASVGSGSYVSKSGDAMSGPLTLPADPTGSNQAATKHYVDAGLAAKASLVAGVVPTAQLGSGSSDGTLCLKGDSTWGACGTSANAATIQNVAVDTASPSDGQVLTYQASSQKYTPKSGSTIGGNPSAGMQVVGNGSSFAAQAKPAIDVRDYGVDCTGSASSDSGLSSVAAAGPHAVIPQGCVVRLSTSKTYALALEFKQGGQLKPDTGVTVTLTGNLIAGRQQIFTNALPGQGTIDFTGNRSLREVYPEWWGAIGTDLVGTYNTPALQAAIYGAFGQGRTNSGGLGVDNRILHLSTQYYINAELQMYHVTGFRVTGENKRYAGLIQTATNARIIDGQSVAYGSFEHVSFSTTASQDTSHPLLDIDYSGLQGSDLRPQNITFDDILLSCNGTAAIGVLISKSGNAQSDNLRFHNSYGSNCTYAVGSIGTSSVSAQNAMLVEWWGGDIQGSPQYGLFANGGSWYVNGTSFENGFTSQTGFDVYCTGAQQYPCIIQNARSESRRLAAGGAINSGLRIYNTKTIFQAPQWPAICGQSGHVGDIVSGTAVGGDGHYYQVTVAGTWGGQCQQTATAGSSSSITNSGASWTVNAFAGQRVSIVGGSAADYYCVIASNTATVLTCNGAGWVTSYSQQYQNGWGIAPSPDNTSLFVIEPNWGTQTSNGTVTFADLNENAIEGPGGLAAQDLVIEDSTIMGGRIYGNNAHIKNVLVSRADWLKFSGDFDSNVVTSEIDNVRIVTPDDISSYAKLWTLPRNNLAAAGAYTGMSQYQMGTRPVVWSGGARGGGASARDVWIGGRTDTYGGPNDVSRAVLEFGGILGRATPIGTTNSNGTDTDIQGGLPTGSGTPGSINFWTGNTGSSGTSIVDGTKRWQITGLGHLFAFTDNTYDFGANGANRPRDLWLGRNADIAGNLTVHGTCTGCGSGSSPLSAKGDVWVYGTSNTRLPVGADNSCLVADSTQALGLKWGSCGSAGGGSFASLTGQPTDNANLASALGAKATDAAVVHNTGNETISGGKTFANDASFQGNVSIAGSMTVGGPYQVVSAIPSSAPTAAPSGNSELTFDNNGKLVVSENAGAVTEVAKVSSSITGNAATATALAGVPTKCAAGQAAVGVDVSGNALGCFAVAASGVDVNASGQVTATHLAGALPVAQGGTGFTDTTFQGTAHKVAMAGTFTGVAGATVCTDASGNLTTSGVSGFCDPPIFFTTPTTSGSAAFPVNAPTTSKLWGIVLPYPIYTATVAWNPTTTDSSANTYDIGLYDATGALKIHTGALAASSYMNSTGKSAAWCASGSSCSGSTWLPAGKYYIELSTSCTASCAVISAANSTAMTFQNGATQASGAISGTLTGSVTPPADVISWGATTPALAIK